MCCCDCLDRCFNTINRIFNVCLAVIGVAVAGYGVYLFALAAWIPSAFNISVVSIGGVLAILAGAYVGGGHKSSCFLFLYVSLMALLMVSTLSAAVVFLFLPRQRRDIVDYLKEHLPDNLRPDFDGKNFENTVKLTGLVCAGLAGLELLSLFIAHLHRKHIIAKARRGGDGSDSDSDSDEFGSGSRGRAGRRTKRTSLNKRLLSANAESSSTTPGAMETEIATDSDSGSQYRTKYAHLYEKYNIPMNP